MKLILRKDFNRNKVNYVFVAYYTAEIWDSLRDNNYVVVKIKEERIFAGTFATQSSATFDKTEFEASVRRSMGVPDNAIGMTREIPDSQKAQPLDEIIPINYTEVGRGPNGNKTIGKIKYVAGLRYMDIGEGVLERFAASNEPLSVDGEYFTGHIGVEVYLDAAGEEKTKTVHTHTNDSNEYDATEDFSLTRNKVVKEKVDTVTTKNVTKTIVKEDPKTVETVTTKTIEQKAVTPKKAVAVKIDKKELDALKALASGESTEDISDDLEPATTVLATESNDFDEDAFLDDLSVDELSNSCSIAGDKLTLSVTYNGTKYQKKYKSESNASRQYEMISASLSLDASSIKELFEGDVATFMKLV